MDVKRKMIIIWRYFFDDGTKLELINMGLSTEEIWKLQELHGACVVSFEQCGRKL